MSGRCGVQRPTRLAEPLLSATVDAIARGCRVLVLPPRDAAGQVAPSAPSRDPAAATMG